MQEQNVPDIKGEKGIFTSTGEINFMNGFYRADFLADKTEAGLRAYAPDYDGCISISTEASLKMMVLPGALVIISPLLAGFLFGPMATAGLLAGAIVSGVQVAISASNTGGAWDNCKKEVERVRAQFKEHAASKGVDLDYQLAAAHGMDELPKYDEKDIKTWGNENLPTDEDKLHYWGVKW